MNRKEGLKRILISVFTVTLLIIIAFTYNSLKLSFCPVAICPLMPFILLAASIWIIARLTKYVIEGFKDKVKEASVSDNPENNQKKD